MKCSTRISWKGRSAPLLTWTGSMDAWSWSLPAGYACPMINKSSPESICSSCYASINRYNMPNVLASQFVRLYWLEDLIRRGKYSVFIETMVSAISHYAKNNYFRVHDSGDFISPDYIDCWYDICLGLKNIQFWFPTRIWEHSPKFNESWKSSIMALSSLTNVSVRPSAIFFNDTPPDIQGYASGTTVVTELGDNNVCPKTLNHNTTCTDNHCRKCWSKDGNVSYLVHGVSGKNVAANALTPKIIKLRKESSIAVRRGL